MVKENWDCVFTLLFWGGVPMYVRKSEFCLVVFSIVFLCGSLLPPAYAETYVWFRFEEGTDGAELITVQDYAEFIVGRPRM